MSQVHDADIAALTARAIDRLGTGDFYDALLDILGSAAPHDLAALVRYSRAAPPDLIIPRVEPTLAMMAYYNHYFAFDPFYVHWKSGGETGVYRLRAMDAGIGRSRYAREFLTAMAIHDEIAVFLPPIGDASPTPCTEGILASSSRQASTPAIRPSARNDRCALSMRMGCRSLPRRLGPPVNWD